MMEKWKKEELLNKYYLRSEDTYWFYEYMCSMIMICEDNVKFKGPLHFVKYVKDNTGYGLKNSKDWYDLLLNLGFITWEPENHVFNIKDVVCEFNGVSDIIYMLENDITIEQFFRGKKLNNIMKKLTVK